MTNPVPTNPTSGVVAPRGKHSSFAAMGDSIRGDREIERLDKEGDELAVYWSNRQANNVMPKVAAQVAASLGRINESILMGAPQVFTTDGASLTPEEIAVVQAYGAGLIQLDAQGRPIGTNLLSQLDDELDRQETQLNMQQMGDRNNPVQRLKMIVRAAAQSRPAPTPTVDVAAKQDEARLEVLNEFGSVFRDDQGVRSLARFKRDLIDKVRDLLSQIITLKGERDEAKNRATNLNTRLEEASTIVARMTNIDRDNDESPLAHIQRAEQRVDAARRAQQAAQHQGQQVAPAPAPRQAPPRPQPGQGQRPPATPAPGTPPQPPATPPTGTPGSPEARDGRRNRVFRQPGA